MIISIKYIVPHVYHPTMNAKYAIGKCRTMCPVDEMRMRQREKLLHLFEMVPGTAKSPVADPARAVKMYNRSAAGKSMTNENCLRPPEVLLKTVKHLLEKVLQDERGSWLTKYDFISDRLRAVRQDMIIQNIPKAYAIYLLEPMVRFHAYSAYILCDLDIFKFDPHLNRKTLQESLNNLLVSYEQVESSQGHERSLINHVNVSRPFFEALNLVLNLGNEEILLRTLCLETKWRTPVVKIATSIALNYMRNNFVKVCKHIKDLSPLLAGILILQLSVVRRNALEIMSVAYSSKNLQYPLNELKNILMYESTEDINEDCKHFSLDSNTEAVIFNKTSFKRNSQEIPPRKMLFLDEQFGKMNESSFLMFGEDTTMDLAKKLELISL